MLPRPILSSMDDLAFKEWLRTEGLALGFARVGFASCEPFESERSRLQSWFSQGRAKHLPYLDPETLVDPRRVLPGAKTALVGFFPYARPDAIPGSTPGTLKLSRYLWGTDYHILLKPRLQKLLTKAQALRPALQGRVCVDTAPLMERQMAARAGLGWQGKHTLLIMGKEGSWGFLAVLLLDVELPPDVPFTTEHCGTCTACIDACPSQAIAPFQLNPNRCMTTYTIETEAEPPPEVAAAIAQSGWAAGCDICQEVCPWNAHPIFGDAALWGQQNRLHTEPAASLRLTPSQWRSRTRRTALRRVRDRHWRRNVDLILGSKVDGPPQG